MESLSEEKKLETLLEQYDKGTFLLLDVDNFRGMKSCLGVEYCDLIVTSIKKILVKRFGKESMIEQIGDDEIVIFVPDMVDRNHIQQMVYDTYSDTAQIYCGDQGFKLAVTMGICNYPKDGSDYLTLYSKADCALLYARDMGRNNWLYYEETMGVISREHKATVDAADAEKQNVFRSLYIDVAETAFRMMDRSADSNAAINLLLMKVKEKLGYDIVAVTEVRKENKYVMHQLYYYASDKYLGYQSKDVVYELEDWQKVRDGLAHGRHFFKIDSDHHIFAKNQQITVGETMQGFRLPLGDKYKCDKIIDFIFVGKEHKWAEREIRFLESFARIISVYALRVKSFDESAYLATMMRERDSVTGLYRFDKFVEHMKEVIASSSESYDIIYTYTDISNFKYINETYGYEKGNMLLREFAQLIAKDEFDFVLGAARVHSDNFVVATRNIWHTTPEQYAGQVDRVNLDVTEKLRDFCRDNMVALNTGLFFTKSDKCSVDAAITNAGYACKQAKANGEHKALVFSDSMMNDYKRELRFISELPEAIANGEIQIYIQPKTLADGETAVGGEALVRWIKKDGEILYPGQFIPVLEKSGAIVDLDYQVYKLTFEYQRKRLDQGLPVVPISMNVSREHLKDDRLRQYVEELLEQYQVPTKYIEFEITETVCMDNMSSVVSLIQWMQAHGIKVSMDDFGSGYSSLNMLDKTPIDVMKIDGIFMENDILEENERIIIECVITMAQKMRKTTVCEGVETQSQLDFLKKIGCNVIQGYFVGKPMPVEEFDKFLATHAVQEI